MPAILIYIFSPLPAEELESSQSTHPSAVLKSWGLYSEAPHGRGNLYAPEIVRNRDGGYDMYFGAQARDGHDRIFVSSTHSLVSGKWSEPELVLSPDGVNHVNDPSVVQLPDKDFLYYSRAGHGVTDTVGLATRLVSSQSWVDHGTILGPGEAGTWNSLLVGRPSVIYDGTRFMMWYDGRADLPPGAPDPAAPKNPDSRRFVGFATSVDGFHWVSRNEPVFGHDAGGIHVLKLNSPAPAGFIMTFESRSVTQFAFSHNGLEWQYRGPIADAGLKSFSPYGHVTPFLFQSPQNGSFILFFGAAMSTHWNENFIASMPVSLSLDR